MAAGPTTPGAGAVNAAARPARKPNAALDVFTKSYVVVGPKVVHGAKKGDTVSLTLTVGQERDLIESGHIRLAS